MSRRIAALAVLSIVLVVPAEAGFRSMARQLDQRLGSRTWLPFLGLARLAVWSIAPRGVHDFQLALWDKPDRSIDGAEVEGIIRREIGEGFTRLVRVQSNRSGEHVFVYARPVGHDIVELFVLAHEHDQTVLVRVAADAAIVARDFGRPRRMAHVAHR